MFYFVKGGSMPFPGVALAGRASFQGYQAQSTQPGRRVVQEATADSSAQLGAAAFRLVALASLLGKLGGAGFADHGDLDLARILHALLDLLGNIAS